VNLPAFARLEARRGGLHWPRETSPSFGSASQVRFLSEISVQHETYIRGNKNKKKIKQADLPAESQEGSSDKCQTANAEHSMHDLSSESPGACSFTEINESHDRGKNDCGAKQAEEHSGH